MICEQCGKAFQSARTGDWVRFCSDECRYRYHNRNRPRRIRQAIADDVMATVKQELLLEPSRIVTCPKCGCEFGIYD